MDNLPGPLSPVPIPERLAGLGGLPSAAAGRHERLTITDVELFRVCPPLQPGILPAAAAADFDVIPKYIVRVHTDAGLIGIGETHRMAGGRDAEPVARLHQAAAELRGCNVLDFNLSRLELPVATDQGAFETAFYDLVGQAVGWPVWRLLGGRAQHRIPVHYWAGKGLTPEELRALAERAAALGFAGVKMKRFNPLPQALEIFASVSPALRITIDLMGHYAGDFLPVVRQLETIGNVMAIEDPPPGVDALEAYRQLRQQTSIPLAMHLYINREGVRGMVQAIAAQACSVFNLGAGSMAEFVARAYLAGEAGMAVWHGSAHELGVLDAAMLHACAAAPSCTWPSDILSHQRVHNLLTAPLDIRDSLATVPDGPGLGVELDMDAVHRYAVVE
jgi:muconate cycloisomerase